jgi:hypothetical protein
MTTVVSGFNVTNSGNHACSLPRFPGAISIAGHRGASDFADFGSSAGSVTMSPKLAGPARGLTLRPGGTAVVLLYTLDSLGNKPHMQCISAPRDGSLAVRMTQAQELTVKVPSDAQAPTKANPTSSAFSSCGVVTVSAFLSWPEAKSIVGVPVPESAATGALPLTSQIKALYAAAP